ncbi:MAG: ECF transporter S component [Candidatus Thorarchaeota archaeon]|jgi:uncharacterized membrane protein
MEMEYFRPSGKNTAVNLALLAIMTALTTILTSMIQIPYPSTGGFFNLGDAMVMLSGLLLGPVGGFFAGGVGSAFADVLLGYTFYAPITLVVKGLEGMAVGYIGSRVRSNAKLNKLDVVAVLIGAIIMLSGYFIAQAFLIGIGPAIGELVTVNLPQVGIGGAVTLLIGPTIRSYLRTTNYGKVDLVED